MKTIPKISVHRTAATSFPEPVLSHRLLDKALREVQDGPFAVLRHGSQEGGLVVRRGWEDRGDQEHSQPGMSWDIQGGE